jgi:tetratricopeptide (TPR) repeat protein
LASHEPTRLSTAKKCGFAAVVCVVVLGLVELLLFAAGVGPQTAIDDPWVGFDRAAPLWTSDADGWVATSPTKLRHFNRQTFRAVKPPKTIRVVCVGGSTTYGRPFDDSTSYSAYLRSLLPIADASHDWEVINAGGVSYASYRVAAVMRETAKYQPDIFVVFSAHNEFLERRTYAAMFDEPTWRRRMGAALRSTRTFTMIDSLTQRVRTAAERESREVLPGEVDERLNHTVGPTDYVRDDRWQAAVVAHYRLNLSRMVAIARGCGAMIVFVDPASNEKDCAPFKLDGHDFFADGLSLFVVGDYAAAETAFRAAIDADVCPLRATTAISQTLRDVADQFDVPIVDFQTKLKASCQQTFGHRCLGEEQFLDHVHPTIEGHRDLAIWTLQELIASKLVDGDMPSAQQIADVHATIKTAVDATDQAIAFRNLAKLTHWAGKFDEAIRHGEDALRLLPGDPESQYVIADSLTRLGRIEEAIAAFEALFATIDYERGFLPFAFLLADQERFDEASAYALMATASQKETTRERAIELLRQIDQRQTQNP